MSIGNLRTEADLDRHIERKVSEPGVVPRQPYGMVALVKEGTPSDDDFPGPVEDGLLALDTAAEEGPVLYVRANDEWVAF